MINKYIFGKPFESEAVVDFPSDAKVFTDNKAIPGASVCVSNDFKMTIELDELDMIFGLGESLGGFNKRGKVFRSWCTDDPVHSEEKEALYGAHPYFIIYSPTKKTSSLYFIDYPGLVTLDMAFTFYDKVVVTVPNDNLNVYYIKEDSLLDTAKTFRAIIGKSFVEPFWAMGYCQSRWGYKSDEDIDAIIANHKKYSLPLDAIFMDIDYMESFRNFTVNKANFPDFKATVSKLKALGVHLVPIIDAGTKDCEEDEIDREGISNGYYCKTADGKVLRAAVWPGFAHFPDFLQERVRKWFGEKFKLLQQEGIDAFWIDMNEPVMFYSEEGIKAASKKLKEYAQLVLDDKLASGQIVAWQMKDAVGCLQNSMSDYESFFHEVPKTVAGALAQKEPCFKTQSADDVLVRHSDIHNLYAFNMAKAVSQANKGIFLLSRASYIGSHRYTSIWMGDNFSWWSHIELALHMLPSLNMAGFIHTGCDLGGFGCNTSRELLLRFLSLGIFTPLMRNHAACGTRAQECYNFEKVEDFRALLSLRYRLIPFLYNEVMKASLEGELMFTPLAFEYGEDEIALHCEDQLLLGKTVMIAPVYTANAIGRNVYLPQNMLELRCSSAQGCLSGKPQTRLLEKGAHFIKCAPNEVVFFVKEGCAIPVVDAALNTKELDYSTITYWGSENPVTPYELKYKGE